MLKKHVLLSNLITLIGLFAVTAYANAANFFVNPTSGSDTNPGTQAAPFKTITKALSITTPGAQVVNISLALGDYSKSSGESFNWDFKAAGQIPVRIVGVGMTASVIDASPMASTICMRLGQANVILTAVSLKNCRVVTTGVGGRSLSFIDTYLESFMGLFRSQSDVDVETSSIAGNSQFLTANGTHLGFRNTEVNGENNGLTEFVSLNKSSLYADGLFVHDMVTGNVVVDVTNDSTAEFHNSEFRDSWGILTGQSKPGNVEGKMIEGATIRVTGEGSFIRSDDTIIAGSAGIAILGEFGAGIKVNGGTYTGNQIGIFADDANSSLNNDIALASRAIFNNTLANWIVSGGERVSFVDNGSFRGGKYGVLSLDNAIISVSNSAFEKVSRPIQFESIGTRQSQFSVGHKLTFRGNATNYASIVASCVEPVDLFISDTVRWIPNVQGADANGHIESQDIKGVKKGNNYWLKNSSCKLVIR
jgi:hypothetical protein